MFLRTPFNCEGKNVNIIRTFFYGFGILLIISINASGLFAKNKSHLIIKGLEFHVLSGKELKDRIIGKFIKLNLPVSGYLGTRYYKNGKFENLFEGYRVGTYRITNNIVCEKHELNEKEICFQIIRRDQRYYLVYLPVNERSSPIEMWHEN